MSQAERLGRTALHADASYCAAVGTLTTALSKPLSKLLGVRRAAVAGAGVAALGWSGLVESLARRPDWERSVRAVALANTAAAVTLLGLAATRKRRGAWILVAGTALDAACFAAVQYYALSRRDELDLTVEEARELQATSAAGRAGDDAG